jgi:hypothetical protein
MNLTNIAQTILSLTGLQRKAFFNSMRRSGKRPLLQSKTVQTALKAEGDMNSIAVPASPHIRLKRQRLKAAKAITSSFTNLPIRKLNYET